MQVEAVNADAEKLVRVQREAVSGFFGTEIPNPPTQLLETTEKIRQEKLFTVEPFYLPRRTFPEGVTFPGQRVPMSPNLYRYMREKSVDADASSLPGQWIILDVTKRPGYKDGKQMYPDTRQFKAILTDLRDQDKIKVPDYYRHIPKDSRFVISADEIDGSGSFVAKAVAEILGLNPDQVTTPSYATFNYVGNLVHPEFGKANTWEWFSNSFGHGSRLDGGNSDFGGLGHVNYWPSDDRDGGIGFRLQVSFPSQDPR